MLIPNLKSDFQKNPKKSQKPKTPFSFHVFQPEFCSKSNKNIFFEFSTIELPNFLNKKFNQVKIWSKFGLFDPTYDH